MKTLLAIASVLVLAGFLSGCRSGPPRAELECTCGSPEADLQGCPSAACVEGERDPDNVDCVCGSLSIPH